MAKGFVFMGCGITPLLLDKPRLGIRGGLPVVRKNRWVVTFPNGHEESCPSKREAKRVVRVYHATKAV